MEIGRLLDALKETHQVACYRISGDEFVLLVKNQDHHEVRAMAENVLTAFFLPFTFDRDHELFVGVSIGVSVSSGDRRNDFKSEIQRADRSMYLSKRMGGNRFTLD
jgi:diguanylate cyclase (GGDEF)-like protein